MSSFDPKILAEDEVVSSMSGTLSSMSSRLTSSQDTKFHDIGRIVPVMEL